MWRRAFHFYYLFSLFYGAVVVFLSVFSYLAYILTISLCILTTLPYSFTCVAGVFAIRQWILVWLVRSHQPQSAGDCGDFIRFPFIIRFPPHDSTLHWSLMNVFLAPTIALAGFNTRQLSLIDKRHQRHMDNLAPRLGTALTGITARFAL